MPPKPAGHVRLAQIKVQAYHKKFITDGCTDIINSATQMGLKTSGVIPLPTKRRLVTIMKGPFVDRNALQQHHHSTHKRLIEFYGESTVGQDATTCVHFLRYLEHTIMQLHPGMSVRVTLFSEETVEPSGASGFGDYEFDAGPVSAVARAVAAEATADMAAEAAKAAADAADESSPVAQ